MTKIALVYEIYQFMEYPFCGIKLLFLFKNSLIGLFWLAKG